MAKRPLWFVLFLLLALQGCVVVPIPVSQSLGVSRDTRSNLDTETPNAFVPGESTRADVLLQLGEPDGRGDDDLWFSYGNRLKRGGLQWAACGAALSGSAGCLPISKVYRSQRLIIRFDANGRLREQSFEPVDCAGSGDCLSASGADILVKARLAVAVRALDAELGQVLSSWQPFLYGKSEDATCRNRVNILERLLDIAPAHVRLQDSGFRQPTGALDIRHGGLSWSDEHPDSDPGWEVVSLPIATDSQVLPVTSYHRYPIVPVRRADGRCTLLAIPPSGDRLTDEANADKLRQAILDAVRDGGSTATSE